jgi:hypothetical protein
LQWTQDVTNVCSYSICVDTACAAYGCGSRAVYSEKGSFVAPVATSQR